MKPYDPAKPPTSQKITKEKIIEMQSAMKNDIKSLMKDH